MTENITRVSPKVKVRREIPCINMVVVHRPKNPVINGKNRWKFPTVKDCCVKLCVSKYHTDKVKISERKGLEVGYNNKLHILGENRKINGTKYFLEISCITRHPINNDSLCSDDSDEPLNKICLQQPLNSLNFNKYPQMAQNDFGFWFRFLGKSCRFHIKISLKIQRGKPERFSEDKVVSTVELDIVNREIISHKSVTKPIKNPSRECSLYSEKEYLRIMQELQSLQDNCLWEKCKSAGNRLLSELDQTKSDYKVCILLEQSKVACQQGELKNAKSLVQSALEMIPTTSRNKALLTARAYTCLSLSHQYDQAFGNAEECLRITRAKLFDFIACEDTGDYYYQEGRILLGFVFKSSIAHHAIINAAKEKMEMAICHFQKSYHSEGTAIMYKICNAKMYNAMLLILANKDNVSILIADQIISSMAEMFASLNCQTKCMFNFAKALLLEQNSDIQAALESGKTAIELANKSGLHVEKQWIEDFLRRLSKKENEESLICFMPNDDTINLALDSHNIYEADDSDELN